MIGTELSARVQVVMIVAQVGALVLFAAVALYLVFAGGAPEGAETAAAAWFSPAVGRRTRGVGRADGAPCEAVDVVEQGHGLHRRSLPLPSPRM